MKHSSDVGNLRDHDRCSRRMVWVMKREILWIPFVGWGCMLARCIAIDRKAGASAVNQVLAQGKDRMRTVRRLGHGVPRRHARGGGRDPPLRLERHFVSGAGGLQDRAGGAQRRLFLAAARPAQEARHHPRDHRSAHRGGGSRRARGQRRNPDAGSRPTSMARQDRRQAREHRLRPIDPDKILPRAAQSSAIATRPSASRCPSPIAPKSYSAPSRRRMRRVARMISAVSMVSMRSVYNRMSRKRRQQSGPGASTADQRAMHRHGLRRVFGQVQRRRAARRGAADVRRV